MARGRELKMMLRGRRWWWWHGHKRARMGRQHSRRRRWRWRARWRWRWCHRHCWRRILIYGSRRTIAISSTIGYMDSLALLRSCWLTLALIVRSQRLRRWRWRWWRHGPMGRNGQRQRTLRDQRRIHSIHRIIRVDVGDCR